MTHPEQNPTERYLRQDRLPHIWCPGCGIGTTVNCFARALEQARVDPAKVAVVSGIGCSGRVAGYLRLDGFHTTHGRAIPFATGLKLANPALRVVVYSGDGDLASIGGNHLIHAARRNMSATPSRIVEYLGRQPSSAFAVSFESGRRIEVMRAM